MKYEKLGRRPNYSDVVSPFKVDPSTSNDQSILWIWRTSQRQLIPSTSGINKRNITMVSYSLYGGTTSSRDQTSKSTIRRNW